MQIKVKKYSNKKQKELAIVKKYMSSDKKNRDS